MICKEPENHKRTRSEILLDGTLLIIAVVVSAACVKSVGLF